MLSLKSIAVQKRTIETLVIPVCQNSSFFDNGPLAGLTDLALSIPEFSGKSKETLVLYQPESFSIKRVVFFGLGKQEDLDKDALRAMAGRAVGWAIGKNLASIEIASPPAKFSPGNAGDTLKALMEGAGLASHVYDKYKREKKVKPLKSIAVLAPETLCRRYKGLARETEVLVAGVLMARDWVNVPANHKRPPVFAKSIQKQAEIAGLKTKILDEKELRRKKFGALLAVSAGSDSAPCLLVMEHRVKNAKNTVALVGKGVTFDSGGINLKPTGSIETMKCDMAGAATVAATLITAAKLKVKKNIIGVIPIVENMISGGATRPGDIVTSLCGKTIEIGNTDAEGRLILADALTYVEQQYQPDVVVDLATLTGACLVALGQKIAGLFSNNDKLSKALLNAGDNTGEFCWPLPLPKIYANQIENDIADIQNMGKTRWGGAITAAIFLSEFVGEMTWAHMDIAGPAFTKEKDDYCGKGGTGFGVRLLCDFLKSDVVV